VLAEFPDARLEVHVVWEPVVRTDLAAPMSRVLGRVDDRRVAQYWDPARIVSADIVRAVNLDPTRYGFEQALPVDYIVWDVVAVFGGVARWERDLPSPAYHGRPLVDAIGEIREALAESLAPAERPRS
jgi:hypothetical protein